VADDGAVFGVFVDGVRRWDAAGTEVVTTGLAAEQISVGAGGVAYGDFGAAGMHRFDPATGTWTRLTPLDATVVEAADDGSLYAHYATGLWRWAAGVWNVLTGNVPSSLRAVDGTVFGVFANGVWRWAGTEWQSVTGAVPESYGISDAGLFHGDFGADGGPDGVWQWSPAEPVWRQPTAADPVRMTVTANGDLYADFAQSPGEPVSGVWKWIPATGHWREVLWAVAGEGGAGVDGSFFATLQPPVGIQQYATGFGWGRLLSDPVTLLTTQR
jgi:hypothetical protein